MSGVGIALGMQAELQKSISVDDTVDHGAKRSSQRAELLAAVLGLRALRSLKEAGETHPRSKRRDPDVDITGNWIIATDSKYVVDGMTDWLPNKWKVRLYAPSSHGRPQTWLYARSSQLNGMRASDGRTPANLDLFLELDQEITAVEAKHDILVGFWYIPRKYNTIADRLAKDAAKRAATALPSRVILPTIAPALP